MNKVINFFLIFVIFLGFIIKKVKKNSKKKIKGILISLELIIFLPIIIGFCILFIKITKVQKQSSEVETFLVKKAIILQYNKHKTKNIEKWGIIESIENGTDDNLFGLEIKLKNGKNISITRDEINEEIDF